MAASPYIATYRLQLTPTFGLDDAAAITPYLSALGISHVYCSPYLQASAGSTHGYDVIDHDSVNVELGGEAALERFQAALRDAALGQIIDIVPNHMAIGDTGNHRWWDVLMFGRASDSARFFDVDWDALGGKVLLPVLADPYGDVLDRGEIVLDATRGEVHYFDHRFPLAPGSTDGAGSLHEVLERQHYRLAHWRAAQHSLNYRRFFDVTTLAGLRVEDPEVFAAVHRRALGWVHDGSVDGLRVDHPDGLREPGEYFRRLRDAAPDAWIVIEKILEPGEELPADWPVDGTTGYDAMHRITSLFVDPAAEASMTRTDALFGEHTDDYKWYARVVDESKRLVLHEVLAAEVGRLVDISMRIMAGQSRLRDFGRDGVRDAIEAVLRAAPVYRTYVTPGTVSRHDADVIAATIAQARSLAAHVDGRIFDWLERVMRQQVGPDVTVDAGLDLAPRLQQLTGPAMAKGVEDTTFYRFARLVALNEVGGDPSRFGMLATSFHEATARAARSHPLSMTATSTHDTKRSEDVRARIALLSEMPHDWSDLVLRWRRRNADRWAAGTRDLDLEHLVYQTMVGAHPLPPERLHEYVQKAMREAKRATSWLDPDERFERAAHAFVDALTTDETFQRELDDLATRLDPAARLAALSQLTLKTMLPGVPDFYQGSELWTDSLVDPDNRRPVDYRERATLLAIAIETSKPPDFADDPRGLAKLWLTHRLLGLRRAHANAFAGETATYRPLAPRGADSMGWVAFQRGDDIVVAAPIRPLHVTENGAGDVRLDLPTGRWRHALDPSLQVSGSLNLATLAGTYHLAVLVKETE